MFSVLDSEFHDCNDCIWEGVEILTGHSSILQKQDKLVQDRNIHTSYSTFS